jgi:sugar-specific transcriptional regulator TrmB
MSDKKTNFIEPLVSTGLTHDEAVVYVELLRAPNTHLQLSRNTSIARTKIYRLVESLERRSLVARRTDERGTYLIASDPATLQIDIALREAELKSNATY